MENIIRFNTSIVKRERKIKRKGQGQERKRERGDKAVFTGYKAEMILALLKVSVVPRLETRIKGQELTQVSINIFIFNKHNFFKLWEGEDGISINVTGIIC